MRSDLPKVLHSLGGRPILQHVIESSSVLRPERINIVVGATKDYIVDTISRFPLNMPDPDTRLNWIVQPSPEGTGQAALLAVEDMDDDSTVVILNGDMPLITPDTIMETANVGGHLNMVTDILDNPGSFGRILRDENDRISGIVEERDATDEQKKIREVNANCFGMKASWLKKWLPRLNDRNSQQEYYLTDIVSLAVADGLAIRRVSPVDGNEMLGANNRAELADLERVYQRRVARHLMEDGLTMMDPARFDLRGILKHGLDCRIDINVILEGKVRIGNNVSIGAHSVIRNSVIGHDTHILENTVIENSMIGSHCVVGPFARIRPVTLIGDNSRIGNFVEVKESLIDRGSKVNHLSYIGDARIGRNVNVGAGVITCNYDGARKHKTIIQDEVFVGSDSQLVAPVVIGQGATIAAGTTITSNVNNDSLVLTRTPQKTLPNWNRRNRD